MSAASEFGKLAQALSFFSRMTLPDWMWTHAAPWRLNECGVWFPLAGAVIGLAPALVWFFGALAMPDMVAAALALALGVWLTGFLHEDGLADTADALVGTQLRDRAMEIMRDSRIGTYGAAVLVFSILLRWSALVALGPLGGAIALVIAHATGRSAITLALGMATYARREGAGSLVAEGMSREDMYLALAITLALALILGWMGGLSAAIIATGLAFLLMLWIRNRIGGYTGDTLGAMEQVAEITVMVVLAAFWGAP